jgi:ADP-dependent NAD(P)H-hydrate dehydratase / NAD(P)H-hydrate epimerase
VLPVVTPEEMAHIDRAATEPVDMLIERAGRACATAAVQLLGGTYGRRVGVIVGKGNNGNDGRVAAALLARRGVAVHVVDAAHRGQWHDLRHRCDLVIDAAYGTGARGGWDPPDVGDVAVLAVDIASGIDGLTGQRHGAVLAARATVTMVALKPGLLLGDGPAMSGRVSIADIGLDPGRSNANLIEEADVVSWLPPRQRDAHKWRCAVWVVAGSPGMAGAATLAASGALRAGAGMVRLGSPGLDPVGSGAPIEAVRRPLPDSDWETVVLEDQWRFGAVVVGPGLGRSEGTARSVRALVDGAGVPVVVDGDGLAALVGWQSRSDAAVVLTPHDGEFRMLAGREVGADRIDAARCLAASTRTVVFLKGACTVVAEPGGRVLLIRCGDERLATAGTGDVLSGVLAALMSRGVAPFEAAAAAAWIHGAAGNARPPAGLVASDLLSALPMVLSGLRR